MAAGVGRTETINIVRNIIDVGQYLRIKSNLTKLSLNS